MIRGSVAMKITRRLKLRESMGRAPPPSVGGVVIKGRILVVVAAAVVVVVSKGRTTKTSSSNLVDVVRRPEWIYGGTPKRSISACR
jgi:hypothetical protein